jgi:cyclopropane fatty-acyl-phospholipid synthase-like methyltransferase
MAVLSRASASAATGVDASPRAIHLAKAKADERGLPVRFVAWDALQLAALGERFDTVLDSGLYHVFGDTVRVRYVKSLAFALPPGSRYFMLCFSERQPGEWGPRRVTEDDIRESFGHGWRIESIVRTTLDLTIDPRGARGWLAAITRAAE